MRAARRELEALSGFPVKRESTVTLQGQTITQTAEVTRLEKVKVEVPDVCGPPADFEEVGQ